MQRAFTFNEGEYYHIYNRGIDKNKIFYSKGDWDYFLRLLYMRNEADQHVRPDRVKDKMLREIPRNNPLVDVCAFALMPHHFHLIVRDRGTGGVSRFMSRLLTSYVQYLNKKYERSGPLMCRPFQAKHIDSEEYFRYLISYVHLNPVDQFEGKWQENGLEDIAGAEQFLRDYQHSSYHDYYVAERDESLVLNKEALPFFINELESVHNMLEKVAVPN